MTKINLLFDTYYAWF